MMIVYEPGMEILVQPEKTVIYISFNSYFRQIYTDGRTWQRITPTFSGYSIGRWVDESGEGRYSMLEVETRGIKGPRLFESRADSSVTTASPAMPVTDRFISCYTCQGGLRPRTNYRSRSRRWRWGF